MAFDAAALDGAAIGQGITLLSGDCRAVLPALAANSVQCVVTSPPYWNLRDYNTAQWQGGDAACDHKDAIHPMDPVPPACRRCQRCSRMRKTAWISPTSVVASCVQCGVETRYDDVTTRGYALSINNKEGGSSGKWAPIRERIPTLCPCGARRIDAQIGLEATPEAFIAQMVAVFREVRRVLRDDGTCWVNLGDSYNANQGSGFNGNAGKATASPRMVTGLAPKQLLMMPARVALALRADGWWLRSEITWCKPSPMPESCTDRPTSATEKVYLLTKRAKYFYDAISIRETAVSDHPSGNGYKREPRRSYSDNNGARGSDEAWDSVGGTRNARNWWVINSKPFSAAHFATFPPELAERCIKAGTSERGCCAACGAPWVRVTERIGATVLSPGSDYGNGAGRNDGGRSQLVGAGAITTGWAPTCKCDAPTQPCTILDPFAGAGTALLVADRLQRNAIGIELNTAYTTMAMERCRADAPLFSSWPPAEDPADQRLAADAMQRDLFAA